MFVVNLFLSAGKAFSDWHRRERACAELMALDDHSLADIGIRRSEIRAIVEADSRAARSAESAASRKDAPLGRRKAA